MLQLFSFRHAAIALSLVGVGCAGGNGTAPSGNAAAAGGDASTVDGDAGKTSDTGTSDVLAAGDSTANADAAPGKDAAAVAETVPVGDHFCLHKAPSDAVGWILGWETACVVTIADPPPLTPALKSAAGYWCTFYDEQATTPASCPPQQDLIGFCKVFPNPGAGLKSWRLIYKSKVLPDTNALSLNPLASGCFELFDPAGKLMPPRKCTGKVTAKVGDQMKDFSSKLSCSYKSDGTQAVYFVEGNTLTADRLQLYITKKNGVVSFVMDDPQTVISKGAGYLEGGNDAFVTPVDAAARTLAATKFAEKGAGLTATFSLGDYKNGSKQIRTITEGVIDIQIEP